MTMDTVRIADLKARLSEHLRKVRQGHTLTVLDRDRAIARLVPYDRPHPPLRALRRPAPAAGGPATPARSAGPGARVAPAAAAIEGRRRGAAGGRAAEREGIAYLASSVLLRK